MKRFDLSLYHALGLNHLHDSPDCDKALGTVAHQVSLAGVVGTLEIHLVFQIHDDGHQSHQIAVGEGRKKRGGERTNQAVHCVGNQALFHALALSTFSLQTVVVADRVSCVEYPNTAASQTPRHAVGFLDNIANHAARAEESFEATEALTTHICSHIVGIECNATVGSWITLCCGRLVDLISRAARAETRNHAVIVAALSSVSDTVG